MEEYEFSTEDEQIDITEKNVYVLITYDIVDNKKRNKLVKFLKGYGFRVQKSCFEALISLTQFKKLKARIGQFATDEDSIRVYRISGKGQVTCFGNNVEIENKSVIII